MVALFALSTPSFASAATECNAGNVFSAYVDGRCVYFSKGDGPDVCNAKNPSGYGYLTFSCPEEFLRKYNEKITVDQAKIDAARKEAERIADEELDKKIQDAIAEHDKQQTKASNDQSVPVQTVIVEPTVNPQPTASKTAVEVKTNPAPASNTVKPASTASEDSLDASVTPAPVPVDVIPAEKKTSLWEHFSGFFSRLNPFSWFK